MKKVLVVFPKYKADDNSHFPYWYQVFEQAGKKLDLMIFFESGNKDIKLNNIQFYLQKITIKPINLIERFFVFIYLRMKGYDNFYIHYSLYSYFILKFISKILGGKVFLWDCEYYVDVPENKLLIQAIRSTDILVTGHEKIAEQYKKILKFEDLETKIVNNWVIKNRNDIYSPKSENKVDRVLYVHDLSRRKGSRELPNIIKNIESLKKEIKFTIIGEGPDFKYIKKEIRSKKIDTLVKLKGKVSRTQVDKEFKKTSIFILPSKSEGFPRVILEAMKYGVPYVATDVGCVREISPKLLQPYITTNNSRVFSQTVLKLLKINSKKKKEIINQMHSKVQDYSLANSVKQFINLFNN